MNTSERREKGTPMNTWKTANAVVELRVRDDVVGWDR
nr:MAG TPA: hypothetical protein [Caudoviricetes sp.]